MTPGSRSTEFWLCVTCLVLGAALSVAGLVLSRDAAVIVGGASQAVAFVGYAVSRGRSKAPRPYLPPAARL